MKIMIRSVLAAFLFMGVRPAMADTHMWTGNGDGTTLSRMPNR